MICNLRYKFFYVSYNYKEVFQEKENAYKINIFWKMNLFKFVSRLIAEFEVS